MPRDKAIRVPEVFPVYVETLAAKQNWVELQDVMRKSPTLPISPVDMSLLKARCAKGLGDTTAIVKGHLDEACRRALSARDMANVIRSTTIAESLGFDDVALQTLRNAVAIPQFQLVMLEKILSIQTKQKDAEGMLSTLKDITATRPGLRIHQENTFYIRLLIGDGIETAMVQASAMAKDGKIAPGAHHFVEALSAFRLADLDGLRSSLGNIDPENLSVGQRAVYAGMLSVSGETSRAFQIAEKLRRTLLLHEEERFLNLAL